MDLAPGVRVLIDTSNGVHRGVVARHWTKDEWVAKMGESSMIPEDGYWHVRLENRVDGRFVGSNEWIATADALTVIDLPDRTDTTAVEAWLG